MLASINSQINLVVTELFRFVLGQEKYSSIPNCMFYVHILSFLVSLINLIVVKIDARYFLDGSFCNRIAKIATT